jgi:hypothetical protein
MRKDIENQNYYENKNIVSRPVDPEKLKTLGLDAVELPRGYCLVGGAARSAAFAELRPNDEILPVRDIDIGYIDDENPDYDVADELAEKYMPDDFAHGYGVAEIESIEDYMNSRDFTMNQVFLKVGNLIMTKRAIADIERGIIRVAEYGESYDPDSTIDDRFVKYRLQVKAELMRAVMSERGYNDVRIDPEAHLGRSNNYFQLALFLQKAYEYGGYVPEQFIANLKNDGIFDEEIDGTPHNVAMRINDELLERPFEWRNEAAAIFRRARYETDDWYDVDDDEWTDEIEEATEKIRAKRRGPAKIALRGLVENVL